MKLLAITCNSTDIFFEVFFLLILNWTSSNLRMKDLLCLHLIWTGEELSWCNGKLNFFSNPQVNGLVALMEGEHVGPFNLGNPGEFTMLELAEVS